METKCVKNQAFIPGFFEKNNFGYLLRSLTDIQFMLEVVTLRKREQFDLDFFMVVSYFITTLVIIFPRTQGQP